MTIDLAPTAIACRVLQLQLSKASALVAEVTEREFRLEPEMRDRFLRTLDEAHQRSVEFLRIAFDDDGPDSPDADPASSLIAPRRAFGREFRELRRLLNELLSKVPLDRVFRVGQEFPIENEKLREQLQCLRSSARELLRALRTVEESRKD